MQFESAEKMLDHVVLRLGGLKEVGPQIWPTKPPDVAARQLSDCLNPERPARLRPDQVLFILRLARMSEMLARLERLGGTL